MFSCRYGNGAICLIVAVLLFGFGSSNGWAQSQYSWLKALERASRTQAEVELFSIVGSNTVGEKLAPALVVGFMQQAGFSSVEVLAGSVTHSSKVVGVWPGDEHSVVAVVPIEAKGSSTGFKALKAGRSDLAASSRPIKSEEVKQLSHLGLMTSVNNEHIVAIDGLAIIVHPSNPLSQLPLQAVQNIFSGKVSNWSQVGGRAGAISIYARDDQSGTYDTFKRLVLNKASLHRKASRFESNDDLSDAVQQDEAGIGFVALPSIGAAKALAVSDGVATPLSPSEFSVATEDYPLSRRLYFYGADHASRKPVISDFINFMRSDAGQAMVADSGYVAQSLFSLPVPSGDSRLADWQRMNLNIRFVDGAADLDNKSIVDVERLADFLSSEANANRKVTLVGFSNPRDGVSQASLSRLRAQNVRWALRNRGIRNKVGALAGNAVAVSDPSSLNAQRNRRVEVWVR